MGLPSKELLSEVLGYEKVTRIYGEDWTEFNYIAFDVGTSRCPIVRNIHEIAFLTRDYFKTKSKHLSLNQSIDDIFEEANSIYESLRLVNGY